MSEAETPEESIKKIEELYENRTLMDRLRTLFKGLSAKRGTREYKEGMIELQRLAAPIVAVMIPAIGVAFLLVFAAPTASNKNIVDITVTQAEDEQELEEQEDQQTEEMQDLTETTDVVMDAPDTTVNVQNPVQTMQTTTPTPQVTSVDAVMDIKAPVMMKTMLADARGSAARSKALSRFGGSVDTEKAVMRALRWLKTQQLPNGSWPGSGGFGGVTPTGFVLLAYLAHGEKPGSAQSEFGPTIQKALEYLMAKARNGGRLDAMEVHALAEAYGMTRNPNIKDVVVDSLNKLADHLVEVEWGSQTDRMNVEIPNLLKMTFNVMALRSAQLSRIKINKIDAALAKLRQGFLLQGNKKDGGFSSDHFGPPGPNYRRTGTWHFMMGCVGMQYLGAGEMPIIEKTLRILDDDWEPPTLGSTDISCCPVCGNYWATMVFFNHGGPRWKKWNAQMSRVYVKGQTIVKGKYKDEKDKARDIGYWWSEDMHSGDDWRGHDKWGEAWEGHARAPIMSTCYVVQQLMVYYRYLPTGSKEAWDVKPEQKVEAAEKDDLAVGIGDL